MNTRRINTDVLNDPSFLGFDTVFNKFHQNVGSTSNYPPYNIVKTKDDGYVIEMAVAGFTREDFDIESKHGELTIKAEVGETNKEVDYLHKGIARRSFARKFTLADTIVVEGASMENGMLMVYLRNVIPEEKKPKKIEVR